MLPYMVTYVTIYGNYRRDTSNSMLPYMVTYVTIYGNYRRDTSNSMLPYMVTTGGILEKHGSGMIQHQ